MSGFTFYRRHLFPALDDEGFRLFLAAIDRAVGQGIPAGAAEGLLYLAHRRPPDGWPAAAWDDVRDEAQALWAGGAHNAVASAYGAGWTDTQLFGIDPETHETVGLAFNRQGLRMVGFDGGCFAFVTPGARRHHEGRDETDLIKLGPPEIAGYVVPIWEL